MIGSECPCSTTENSVKVHSVLLTLMSLSLRMRHASWSLRSVFLMATLTSFAALVKLPLARTNQFGFTSFNWPDCRRQSTNVYMSANVPSTDKHTHTHTRDSCWMCV